MAILLRDLALMSWHEVWHVAVLGSTLFAAAGLIVLLLGPLVLDESSPGLHRARGPVLLLVGVAAVLLLVEWTVVH